MRIVLHLGAHRTANSSLQRLLSGSDDTEAHGTGGTGALHPGGLAFWGPGRLRAGLFDGLHAPRSGVPARQDDRPANRVALRAGMAERAGAQLLVVSDPEAMAPIRQISRARALYPDAGMRVARLAQGFAGHDLTLGVAIRCYDAFWASVLGWGLPRGGPLPLPGLCDRLVTQPRRWRHVIADIANAVPQARLLVWTHEAMAGCPADLVERLTGRRLPQGGGGAWTNRTAPLCDLRGYLRDIGADPALARGGAGRFMPFDPHQRAAMRDKYAEDLAWLCAGADGLADYIETRDDQDDAAGARTRGPTGPGHGRGPTDDGEHARRLA